MTKEPGLFAFFGANSILSEPALTMPFQLSLNSSVEGAMGG